MFGWFKKKEIEVESEPVIMRKEEVPKPVKKVAKPTKTRYLCNSCGYRFSRGVGIEFNSTCPYCGKKDVQVDETADAQKLIESTKEIEDRFEFRR
jgi:transcription initiation factor IIE alpha subunit